MKNKLFFIAPLIIIVLFFYSHQKNRAENLKSRNELASLQKKHSQMLLENAYLKKSFEKVADIEILENKKYFQKNTWVIDLQIPKILKQQPIVKKKIWQNTLWFSFYFLSAFLLWGIYYFKTSSAKPSKVN